MNQQLATVPSHPAVGRAPRRAGAALRVAVVSATWHRDIVDKARHAAIDVFESQAPKVACDSFDVPGAFELPLHAKLLARSGRYDAIVAAAFVVDGGIYRHEFVAAAVIDGLMRVQLETEVPVLSLVLTPHQFHEHGPHRRWLADHMVDKGREVARACLDVVTALERLRAGVARRDEDVEAAA